MMMYPHNCMIYLVAFCTFFLTSQGCSSWIEATGLSNSLDKVCTNNVESNTAELHFTVKTSPSDSLCTDKEYSVTEVVWALYHLDSLDNLNLKRETISKYGSPNSGNFTIENLLIGVYGFNGNVMYQDVNSNTIEETIVIGYFVNGCNGTYSELTKGKQEQCETVFQIVNYVQDTNNLQYCGAKKANYGDMFCEESVNVTCRYNQGRRDKNKKYLCYEGNITFGKVTQESHCTFRSDYFLNNNGIYSKPSCTGRFDICIKLKGNIGIEISSPNDLAKAGNDQQIIHEPIIICQSNCEPLTNPKKKFIVTLDCTNCSSEVVQYDWSLSDCSSSSIENCSVGGVSFPDKSSSNMFEHKKGGSFTNPMYQGIFVTVKFQDGKEVSTHHILKYSPVPTKGVCEVLPPTGYSLVSDFNVTCVNFTVPDGFNISYRMFSNTVKKRKGALRFYIGDESVYTGIKLPEGPADNNYTLYIVVKAMVKYGPGTMFYAPIQVLPMSASDENLSAIDLVSTITLGGANESNQIDDMVNSGNSEAAVQLIGIMSSMINDMNDTEDGSLTEQKREVRSSMVSNLGKVNVSDFETITSLTAVLNDVTDVKSELSEQAQDDATDLYDGLADSFDNFLSFSSDNEEVTETATSILQGVTSILDVVTESGSQKLGNNISVSDTEPDDILLVEDKAKVDKVKNSTGKLLNTLNKVSGSMLTLQKADEPPTIIETDTVTVSVQKVSPGKLSDKPLSPGSSANSSKSSVQFSEAIPGLTNNVGIKMIEMKKNPFIWDSTARDVNSAVLTLDLNEDDGSPVTVSNLSSPVEISLKTPATTSGNTEIILNLTLIKNNGTLEYDRTKLNMVAVNFTFQQDKTAALKLTPLSNVTNFKILISDIKQPGSLDAVLNDGFNYPDESHLQTQYADFTYFTQNLSDIIGNASTGFVYFKQNLSNTMNSQTIYVGIALDINDTEVMDNLSMNDTDCLNNDNTSTCVIEVPVVVETKVLSCTYWDDTDQQWSSTGCEVSPYTTTDTLKCACTHLTSFAGGVFVLPNVVDPIGDAALFLTFFDNPVVVTTVVIVWIVYFFLVHWARRADKMDTEKVGVIFCNDNDVTHRFTYLVCVVTGWWTEAGTTANVFMYIQGRKGASPKKKLSTTARLCFQTGYEDWFLVTMEENLGDITQVTFWHDNTGTSPHWYLGQAYIQDQRTGKGWTFIYNDWLAVDRGAILQTTGTVAAVTDEQLKYKQKHNFMMKTVQGFRDSHLWISVFSKRAQNTFTRVQRLTCALSLLLTTMLTNIMFYGIPTDEAGDQLGGVGGINISLSALVIGIQSSLIMFPVNLLILQMFIRVKRKGEHLKEVRKRQLASHDALKKRLVRACKMKDQIMKQSFGTDLLQKDKCKSPFTIQTGNHHEGSKTSIVSNKPASLTNYSTEPSAEGGKVTARTAAFLPWWCLYISWVLVIAICLISSYFVMLYGLKYGYDRSVQWLVSFLTGFTQSAFIVQPIKVICIAVLLALILKKTATFEDLGPNIELEKDEEYVCLAKDHKEIHIPYSEPLSARLMVQIRHRLKLEWLMNATILDIILYCVYLTLVMSVVHGHRDVKQAYRNTLAIEDVLVNPGCKRLWQCFYLSKADTVERFHQYLYDVAIPNLADFALADHDYATPGSSHFLVGPFRLRQLRVARGTCASGMEWLLKNIDMRQTECMGAYWLGHEENKHYHLNWTSQLSDEPSSPTMWTYQSAWELKTIPYTGKLGTYSGGGYVLTMPTDSSLHQGTVDDMWNSDWIDERTRAIFIEFTLYNPNADLFSVVRIIFEFSNSGAVMPHHEIFTTRLYHYTTDFGIYVMVCEISFLLFNIAFTRIEYKRYKKLGRKEYFSDKWVYLELLQIALSYSVIGLFFQRLISVNSIMKDYRASFGQEFVSFYTAVSWDYILGYAMAFLVGLVTMKFIKLLEFNKRMFMLSDIVSQSKGALISFIFLAVLFAFGFAHFAMIAFGKKMKDYKSFMSSLMSLFNFSLYVSDFPGLQNANRILGPLFFFVFVFVVLICFLTIFVAILNFGINEAKLVFAQRRNKFEIVDYISSKLRLLIGSSEK